ncbi:nucleotidyltransferase family protein [Novipirellula caenicola]
MNSLIDLPLKNGGLMSRMVEQHREPEFELMICCSRRVISAATARRIVTLLHSELDWGRLVAIAESHGVMPLVHRGLMQIDSELVNSCSMLHMAAKCREIAAGNLFLAGELLRLIKLFQDNDLAIIPFKGPMLAASAYQSVALRQFGDLDILVAEERYRNAKELLSDHGFKLLFDLGWECHFAKHEVGVGIDLHRRLLPAMFPFPFDFATSLRRLEPIQLFGSETLGLSAPDNLLVVCGQLVKDATENKVRLEQVCDIAELVSSTDDLDWTGLMDRAKKMGCMRMLSLGVLLAYELLDAPVPDSVILTMSSDRSAGILVKEIEKQLSDRGGRPSYSRNSFLQRARFHCRTRERLQDKAFTYCYRGIVWVFGPSENEQRILPLPEKLRFLHSVLRPFRLLVKYFLGKYGLNPFRRPL